MSAGLRFNTFDIDLPIWVHLSPGQHVSVGLRVNMFDVDLPICVSWSYSQYVSYLPICVSLS